MAKSKSKKVKDKNSINKSEAINNRRKPKIKKSNENANTAKNSELHS